MKRIISILLIILLITACGKDGYEMIDANKAKELIDNGTVIIDVREPDEYAEGHIMTAVNITAANFDTLTYPLDTPIIVYCATGVRSAEAAKILVEKGYTKVYNLDGGILNAGELLGE